MRAQRAPLYFKMLGPLLATSRAFVAENVQDGGAQLRAWSGWVAEPGAQGLQNPKPLWDGIRFSHNTIPGPSTPGSPAWGTGIQKCFVHGCSGPTSDLGDPHGGGSLYGNHRGKADPGNPSRVVWG